MDILQFLKEERKISREELKNKLDNNENSFLVITSGTNTESIYFVNKDEISKVNDKKEDNPNKNNDRLGRVLKIIRKSEAKDQFNNIQWTSFANGLFLEEQYTKEDILENFDKEGIEIFLYEVRIK